MLILMQASFVNQSINVICSFGRNEVTAAFNSASDFIEKNRDFSLSESVHTIIKSKIEQDKIK